MRMRAFLLIAILIGGTFAMIHSVNDNDEKRFNELLSSMESFVSISFTKPPTTDTPSETWTVDDEAEIKSLLDVLEDYHVRKLKSDEIQAYIDDDQFIIGLKDGHGNSLHIVVNENLIIHNSLDYYEVIDGPLDADWFVQFIIDNQ